MCLALVFGDTESSGRRVTRRLVRTYLRRATGVAMGETGFGRTRNRLIEVRRTNTAPAPRKALIRVISASGNCSAACTTFMNEFRSSRPRRARRNWPRRVGVARERGKPGEPATLDTRYGRPEPAVVGRPRRFGDAAGDSRVLARVARPILRPGSKGVRIRAPPHHRNVGRRADVCDEELYRLSGACCDRRDFPARCAIT